MFTEALGQTYVRLAFRFGDYRTGMGGKEEAVTSILIEWCHAQRFACLHVPHGTEMPTAWIEMVGEDSVFVWRSGQVKSMRTVRLTGTTLECSPNCQCVSHGCRPCKTGGVTPKRPPTRRWMESLCPSHHGRQMFLVSGVIV